MLSSSEVAALLAAQNQAFSGQNQFSQQIGVSFPSGFNQQGGQSLNMGPRPGFTAGNSFAGTAMAGMGGMATAAGVGVSTLGMFGKLGPIAPLVDPFSAASMGFRMGGIGMGMGMGAMAMLPGMMASHGMQSFIQGGQGQMMIQNQLAQNFNHNNPAARGGSGFSRDDAMAIGNQVRSLAHIPEMMTSVEELTKLLPKLKSMGVMQGVKDATEFSQRFKDAVKTIRDVSRMLGSSMEEATQFFEHSRSVGFLGRKDQLKNVLNSQFTSGVTGMSMNQVGAMQQGGANMALQSGARRSLGVEAVTNISQSIGLAQRGGHFREGALEDFTGLQGPEAVMAASHQFAEAMTQVGLRTPAGKAIIAGAMKMEDGRGVIDKERIAKLKSGELNWGDFKRKGRSLSEKEKFAFFTDQEDLAMGFAGQLGPGGFAGFMDEIVGHKGDGAVRKVLKDNTNLSATGVDMMIGLSGQAETGDQERAMMARIKSREGQISDGTDPKKVLARLKTRMHAKMFGGLEQAGAKTFDDMSSAFDEVIDDALDRHVATMSEDGVKKLSAAFASGSDREELKKILAEASGLSQTSRTKSFNLVSDDHSVGSFLNSVGNSSVTGRTASGDFRARMSGLGFSGSQDNMGAARAKIGALSAAGSSGEFFGARGVMEGLVDGDDEFRGATQSQKMEILKKKLAALGISGSAIDLMNMREESSNIEDLQAAGMSDEGLYAVKESERKRNTLIRGLKKLNKKVAFGKGDIAELAGHAFLTDPSRLDRFSGLDGMAAGASNYEDVKVIEKRISEAVGKLKDSNLDVSYLQKAGVRDALTHASANANVEKKVGHILNLDVDDDAKSRMLANIGVHVDAKDMETFRNSHYALKKAGQAGKDILADFGAARSSADVEMFQKSVREASVDIDEDDPRLSGLREAVSAVGNAKGGDINKLSLNVGSEVEKLTELAKKLPEKEREALLAKAGKFGVGIGGALGANRRILNKSNVSQKDVAKAFGVDVKDIEGILTESNIDKVHGGKLTETAFSDIQKKVASLRAGGALVTEGKVQQSLDKDEQLLKTLKEIDITMKTSNSLMALKLGEGSEEKAINMLRKINSDGSIKLHSGD